MADPRRQFRVLYRDFLSRMVDLELLASRGDIEKLLGQFGALLAAFSFTFLIGAIPKYMASSLPAAQLAVRGWGEEEFLVGASMAIAGLFSVLAWNNVFPDRRDSLILGLLPVRTRTIFLAKTAAIVTALGVSVVAVNCFTGLAYPLMVLPHVGPLGILRPFYAYWVAVLAGGLFVCCTMLAVQGMAAQLFSYRLFVRVSSFLQLAAFFAILATLFLKPSFPAPRVAAWMPSFWFFGLLQQLNGSADAALSSLAARAVWALAISFTAALVTATLAYGRNIRRIVEQPDIAPSDRTRPAARLGSWLATRWIVQPVERAIVLFTARTIARSRQHRLLIAAYGGIGMAIAMAYSRDLIYGRSAWNQWDWKPWYLPNVPMMIGSLVLLVFSVLGARAVFALPLSLPANWIFRVTVVHRTSNYFAAVRKSVFLLAAGPVCVLAAAAYIFSWPLRPALEHIAVLCAAALLLVSRSFDGFQKIPFACSYLPGKANINVKLGTYAMLFLLLADAGVHLEIWALDRAVAFTIIFGLLLTITLWSHRHWKDFASSPYSQIQFEDLPVADVNPLDLHNTTGGGWTGGEKPGTVTSFPGFSGGVNFTTLSSWDALPEPVPLGTRIEQALHDLRHGARIFRRSPGFSVAAVFLIALGIGGNTAIFSMIHGLLTKPAPGVEANGLVVLAASIDGRADGTTSGATSYPEFLDYSARTRTMQSLATARFARFTVGLPDGTWQLRGFEVSGSYIQTIGLRLAKGRDFTADEVRGAAPLPAIIAWHVWQNQFHSAADVVGRSIAVNGLPATVVGVGPPGFRGLEIAPHFEICLPLEAYMRTVGAEQTLRDPRQYGYAMLGRLAQHVTLAQAQAEFDVLSPTYDPATHHGKNVVLADYPTVSFGPLGGPQSRLFRAVLVVAGLITLLIVCANVANLMLVRALARQKEISIRIALGAPWTRIISVLLAEGVVLSLTAGVAALIFAGWAARIVGSLLPPIESGARFSLDLSPDWKVAAYALSLVLFCTLVIAIVPAARLWRQSLTPRVGRGPRLAGLLVIAQLALCVLLAASGGFAWRALSSIDNSSVYITRDHLLLAAISTTGAQDSAALLERIRARLLALPRVSSVSWALAAPPASHSWKGVRITDDVRTQGSFVGPDYLHSLGVPMLAGRDLASGDTTSAVINQKLAEALWPGQSALGRTFSLPFIDRPVEVVGVAPDAPYSGVADDGSYTGVGKSERLNFVFLPDSPADRVPGQKTFHVRYTGDRASMAAAIRATIHDTDPSLPVFSVRSMEEEWSEFTGPLRLIGTLVQIFAAAALILASMGLYAVVSFQTARRTREFGIRAALGASPRQTVATALRAGLTMAAIGLAAGLGLTLVASRAARSLLFGIAPADAPVLLTVTIALAAVALVACYIPARRAAKVDPVEALRE